MLAEFIDRLLELASEDVIDVDGKNYSARNLKPVMDPLPDGLAVTSLRALVDLLKCKALGDGSLIVHVENHGRVTVRSRETDEWNRRGILARATLEQHAEMFTFGMKFGPEGFTIALQAAFVDTPTRKEILAIIGNVRAEQVQTSQDDGVTQHVAVKAGVHLKDQKVIPNPVSLAPYRTFREVNQPESDFIFRAHNRADELPAFSLTEYADGGAWRLEAIKRVAEWLRLELQTAGLDVPVVA